MDVFVAEKCVDRVIQIDRYNENCYSEVGCRR